MKTLFNFVLLFIGIMLIVGACNILFNSGDKTETGSKPETETGSTDGLRLCDKHHVYYNPEEHDGKCPQCVDESIKKSGEESRQKFNDKINEVEKRNLR